MYSPALQPVSNSEIYIFGDVEIHPSAVIAAGVILQAAPGNKILIGAGACIGMGSVLNAYLGDIKIESGVILGAGVLIIGHSTIGKNACLGTVTTIFNASVDSMAILPPGSLIGDTSRQIEEFKEAESDTDVKEKTPTPKEELETDSFWDDDTPPKTTTKASDTSFETKKSTFPFSGGFRGWSSASSTLGKSDVSEGEVEKEDQEVEAEVVTNSVNPGSFPEKSNPSTMVGKVYINNLLITLFPHRQPLNDLNQDKEIMGENSS